MGIGDGASLKVDPELLAQLGGELQTAAAGLPAAPEPFIVSGTDPISLAIAGRLPDVEGGIQEALPQVKADATTTASNVIAAAGKYKGTDEQLAAEYEKHQFDQAGSSSSGSAGGGGDAMGQMGQMMSMPMQMASQAAQLPMQAMSAVTSAPQAVMQGVQQIGQMAGGMGKAEGGSPSVPADAAEQKDADAKDAEQKDTEPKDADAKDAEQKKQEPQPAAAPGPAHAERAPTSVPQQSSPRHAAPDPQVNL